MTPGMETALAQRRVMLTGLVRINLQGGALRLCDGAGTVTHQGEAYSGRHPAYGALGEVEAITEATGDTIPGLEMTLLTQSLAGAVQLGNPANQGAAVRVWLAVVDEFTGAVVPEPELLFAGEIDTVTIVQNSAELTVQISVASVFERLFEPDEGARLSSAFHRSIFPNEAGFDQMTGTTINRLWGPGEKPPAVVQQPQVPQGGANRYF